MTTITRNMTLQTVTKGAVKYAEVDGHDEVLSYKDGSVGTIYIRKSAFTADNWPQHVTVTITERE